MKDDTLGGTAGNAVSEWQKLLTHKGIKMVNDSGKQYGVDGEFGSEQRTVQRFTRNRPA